MITLTDRASAKLKEVLEKEKAPEGTGLRVGVKGGGCSGMTYDLELSTLQKGDKVVEKEGVKVFLDPKSLLFLFGSELDYTEGTLDAGFKIQNPNVKESCGCGHSFTV